ncbi:hypothetical protein ACFXPT_11710 [Streptomyces goshikiensis]|uniref:hypothetical protein n=1 Tax=Streptomyces goshikiensis TaxID=1942 RepID=UPI0036ACEEB6
MSPLRAYCETLLGEEPPETPRAPYSPSPPAWMVEPVVTYDVRGNPVFWVDEGPLRAYEHRLGRAVYALRQEDLRDQVRAEAEVEQSAGGAWERKQRERDRQTIASKLQGAINHRANLLTVKQRQERGLTAPWNRKPLPVPDAEVLPEAEMCWAPWWTE